MNTPYAISVDWLQVYTLISNSSPIPVGAISTSNGFTFSFTLLDYQSAMFKNVVEVKLGTFQCAVMECTPRSPKLNSSMCLIKLSNRVLYSNRYILILYSLMDSIHVIYKGITRIDLCYDCNRFADGRSPARFINNFVMKPDTEIGGYCRKGSDEFICHGKKSSGSSSKINYISFGSPQSRVRSYIYDKTIELAEVKDKPWIRELWEQNGLISNEKTHVFRSEISIKSEGTDLLNMNTGELFRLSPIYLESQPSIEKLFHYYAYKYLHFRINGGQKYRKNYARMELFAHKPEITCKPTHISKLADTGRMEKIVYNKLEKLSTEYSDLSEARRASLQSAMEFLKELQGIKSSTLANEQYKSYLDSFKGTKFVDIHVSDYFDSIQARNEAFEAYQRELVYQQWAESLISITSN